MRRNARRLLDALGGAELWAVVKANAYGHGAADCARAALEGGATALCVATVAEALALRGRVPRRAHPRHGPGATELATAREARLELVVSGAVPEGIPVHVKLDTGMGRWGLSELADAGARTSSGSPRISPPPTATSTSPVSRSSGSARRPRAYAHLTRHAANSAAALRLPEARFDAARCGIALYGLSPFGTSAAEDGLEPALSWTSELALVEAACSPGESTGYGRRFVAERETWIGIVPVGYADGFRRDLTGTEVLRRRRAPARCRHDLDGRLRGRARPPASRRARR